MIALDEQPTPETEPAEPFPGGVDAIGDEDLHPVVPDLPPADNPAIQDAAPDELSEPEATDDGATTDGASEPEKEAPA